MMIKKKKRQNPHGYLWGCQATNLLLCSENRGKELSIFLAFPIQTVFQIAGGVVK